MMVTDYDVECLLCSGGWTLTGETRTYKATDGEFKRLKPSKTLILIKEHWGAWEVALSMMR